MSKRMRICLVGTRHDQARVEKIKLENQGYLREGKRIDMKLKEISIEMLPLRSLNEHTVIKPD